MFEPVHGSAPDIAGKNIANPIASIWTAVMMLEHLEESEAAGLIMNAIEKTVKNGIFLTKDLGGTGQTHELTNAIINEIKNS